MSSPKEDNEALHVKMTTAAHNRNSASGRSSAFALRRFTSRTPSPLLLPPNIDEATPEPPEEDLHEQNSLSPARDFRSTTPSFFNAARLLSRPRISPAPTPAWDPQCECGGISPHYHGRGG